MALVISDVVLINMWMSDIGRYKGAGQALLTIIFEANLKIFGDASKKTMCFVIRDYDPNTSLKIKHTIITDMEKIWASIHKPEVYENKTIHDYFLFDFELLPNFIYCHDEFEKSTK